MSYRNKLEAHLMDGHQSKGHPLASPVTRMSVMLLQTAFLFNKLWHVWRKERKMGEREQRLKKEGRQKKTRNRESTRWVLQD
jgi:hypothetical protein